MACVGGRRPGFRKEGKKIQHCSYVLVALTSQWLETSSWAWVGGRGEASRGDTGL